MSRRGFTLLEVLMAFGASSILLLSVYFFYFGILKTGISSGQKIDLNDISERAIVSLTNDLRNATAFTEFRPNQIVFQRLAPAPITSEEMAGTVNQYTVSYELVKEKGKGARLLRKEPNALGNEAEKLLIQMDDSADGLFTGFVYDPPTEKDDTVPKFHVFNTQVQTSSELPRITLVRVSFDFKVGETRMQLVSKIFLPVAHNNVVQGTSTNE